VRCQNEFAFLERQEVRPYDAGQVHPTGQPNDEDDDNHATTEAPAKELHSWNLASEEFGHHQEQEQLGDVEHGLSETHQDAIYQATVVTRDGTNEHTHDYLDYDGGQANQ